MKLLLLLYFITHYETAAQQRSIIIFVMLDEADYGDFNTAGSRDLLSPAIDEMAFKGFKFIDFFSGSVIYAPIRCVFMNGLHYGHSPRRDYLDKASWQTAHVP